jgi:hypothetical protein
MRNLAAKLPEDVWPDFKVCARGRLIKRLGGPTRANSWPASLPTTTANRAVACFMDDFEACIARVPGDALAGHPDDEFA